MNAIIEELKARARSHPHNPLLEGTIAHLLNLQRSAISGEPRNVSWDAVRRDFYSLEAEGLWQKSETSVKVLDELRSSMGGADDSRSALMDTSLKSRPEKVDYVKVAVPTDSTNLHMFNSIDTSILPQELIDILKHTYFLHVLATDPAQVLPPGKSLLSVLSRPHSGNGRTENSSPSLHDSVEDMVHKAFWNEAVESLSNPEPSVQLARIKHLYKDLEISLTPLLPARHPVLVALSSPLSPTSSPLLSAIAHLREVLASLRERCASARDTYIDRLLTQLDAPPPAKLPAVALAGLVVGTVKSTIDLAEAMKDDLSQFVLGSMGEKQLKALVAQQARTQERSVLLGCWGPEAAQKKWSTWIGDTQAHHESVGAGHAAHDKIILRLVQALGSTTPVSCNIPTKPTSIDRDQTNQQSPSADGQNRLPPPFFFTIPSLLYIQNFLQALVIAACLRLLTRLSTPSSTSGAGDGADFMPRIWALLAAEISEDPALNQGSTKLVNLADEVVRARNLATCLESSRSSLPTSIDASEEKRLRSAVERTLQPSDPVFILLQKRLLGALADGLVRHRESDGETVTVPERMQTGRDREGGRAGKRPRLMLDPEDIRRSEQVRTVEKEKDLVVKGFEDPVLVMAVGEALGKIRSCVRWVEEAWGDPVMSRDRGPTEG